MDATSPCKFASRLALTMVCALLASCATLPDVRSMDTALDPGANPTIANSTRASVAAAATVLDTKKSAQANSRVKAQAALEEAATGVPLIAGNQVALLFDGPQTMTAMIAAIGAAKDHIHLETYIFDQDELGLRFADLLIRKQREGVGVAILYDSVGTLSTPQAFFERMKEAGIQMTAFNPVNPVARIGHWQVNNRDHRKLLIVDGKVAFTGGVNISATYATSSLFRSGAKANSKVGWRDTHVRIDGPAVAALQNEFLAAWRRQNKDVALTPMTSATARQFFPLLPKAGDKVMRILASEPGGEHEIYKSYSLAMQDARKSIHMTAAYFVPDEQTIATLCAAAGRGVDVKIILPGVSDSSIVFHAGHRSYSTLLAAGVRIYHLQVAVLHAKTAVIDGNWSTVGSSNIDMRSFAHNHELNVVVLGDAFGAQMESAFAEDLRDSHEITVSVWNERSLMDRMREFASGLVDYWL